MGIYTEQVRRGDCVDGLDGIMSSTRFIQYAGLGALPSSFPLSKWQRTYAQMVQTVLDYGFPPSGRHRSQDDLHEVLKAPLVGLARMVDSPINAETFERALDDGKAKLDGMLKNKPLQELLAKRAGAVGKGAALDIVAHNAEICRNFPEFFQQLFLMQAIHSYQRDKVVVEIDSLPKVSAPPRYELAEHHAAGLANGNGHKINSRS